MPAAAGTLRLQISVSAAKVKVQVRHAHRNTTHVTARKNDSVTALRGWGIDRLEHLVHPILPAHGLGHRSEPKAGIGHVCVCVNDPTRQPILKVLRPESAIHVRVLPVKMKRR